MIAASPGKLLPVMGPRGPRTTECLEWQGQTHLAPLHMPPTCLDLSSPEVACPLTFLEAFAGMSPSLPGLFWSPHLKLSPPCHPSPLPAVMHSSPATIESVFSVSFTYMWSPQGQRLSIWFSATPEPPVHSGSFINIGYTSGYAFIPRLEMLLYHGDSLAVFLCF